MQLFIVYNYIFKVTAIEVAHIFHAIKHNQSYNALDCLMKFVPDAFSDSSLAKKISCGRTKAEIITKNVLAPYFLSKVIDRLKEEDAFFSIQTDASNRKNQKMFPLSVSYFTKEDGINFKILDFFENPDESSAGMFSSLSSSLSTLKLKVCNIAGFGADNTNANFGSKNSLYVKFQETNNLIVKSNCHAHIINNAVKHASNVLLIDVENLILKIYAHFSISAKRREELKDFHNFVDNDYHEIIRHVTTRWLSLLPCIDRILGSWSGLNSYFSSKGESLPNTLKSALHFENDEISKSIEIYMLFLSNILVIFQQCILKLESNKVTYVELYGIINELRVQIQTRISEEMFGFIYSQKLRLLLPAEARKIKNNFIEFLKDALNYIDKRIDVTEKGKIAVIGKLNISKNHFPAFKNFTDAVDVLQLASRINIDKMFDEYAIIKDFLNKTDAWHELSTNGKWVYVFKNCENSVELFKLLSFALCLPVSSAFSERIFSHMNIKWRDERNRCSVNLIKSELIVAINSNMNCKDFLNDIKNNEKLLKAAKSNEKYET